MNIVIDRQPPFQLPEEPEDLLSAVAMVSERLRKQGRAIVSLQVDGRVLTPDSLPAAAEGKGVDEVGTIEVRSEAIATLVRDCLRELENVLPELPQACHRLAEVFQSEHPESGYEPFERLADIWKTIKEREIQIVKALNLDVDGLEVNGQSMTGHHESLNEYMREAAEALKAGDCVLLGDLLEYELAPRAETEAAIAAVLRSKIEPDLTIGA